MNERVAKLVSDSNAQIMSALGCSLQRIADHPKITSRTRVQSSGSSEYTFLLEELFYGKKDSVVFRHPERHLHFMEDIWLTGSEGHIFFDSRTVFDACPSLTDVPEKKIRRPLRFLEKRIDSPVFILGGRAPGNRAHFLMEHLPRLVAALESIQKISDIKILVTPKHRKWQLDYLGKFGICADRVVEGSETTTFCRQALYVPLLSEGGREVVCEGRYYDVIRGLFAPVGKPESKQGGPVFISRQDAATRRLTNEKEIFKLTKKFFPGLSMVTMSSLSLAEQIDLFQQSTVIIGPHGQPFRNALFANNALLIQLIPGENDEGNEYQRWGRNFNCIGSRGKNHCISLFNEERLEDGASHWIYNPEKLGEELNKVLSLRAEIG